MEASGGFIMCNWLPKIINQNNYANIQAFIDDIYNIFTTDFFINRIVFEGKQVNIATKLLNCKPEDNCKSIEYNCDNCPFQNKFDIFNHIITGKINTYRTPGKFRLERAERIHWIKPIIDNYKNGVLYFNYPTKKGIEHYFWLKTHDFIVIFIEKKSKKCYLKTAFYIDDKTYEKKFGQMYKYYILKKPTT